MSYFPGENFIFHFELSYIVWNFVTMYVCYLHKMFLYIAVKYL